MSVTPEPISRNNEGQSDSIISNKTQTPEESFLLPSILRGAAYISSGGRVYRLFSDDDEISFPIATFEKTLQFDPFDPLPEIPPIEDIVPPLADISEESLAETFENLLSDSPVDPVMNRFAAPSILQLKPQPPTLLITESITENCPQEQSICPKLPSKEKNSAKNETYKIFSEVAHEEPTNTNIPTPLYPIPPEKTTLKLFEVFPELTISPDLSPATVPAETVPAETTPDETVPAETVLTTTATTTPQAVIPMSSQSVTATPIVRMIRLEVPLRPCKQKQHFYRLSLRRHEKIQHAPSTQYDTAKPDDIEFTVGYDKDHDKNIDKNIDQVIRADDTGLTIPPTTEPSPPEPSPPELPQQSPPSPPQPESSLPESKPNTLLFPSNVLLSGGGEDSYKNKNESQAKEGTWRLIWQSHWPEYLKSLELAATDQICFLADHLEIQKEQKRSVISFNSFQPGDGCTTLALCAARELAERGYRLLLVDAHRQNPELPQLLHLKTNPDFYEIITLIPDRLELLPWSETSIEINSKDHITQSFTEIVGSFREDYDFILLDNGSLVECPLEERVVIWREMCSDGVLLVLNMKSPPLVSVRSIAQRLFQNQIELLGIVENYV